MKNCTSTATHFEYIKPAPLNQRVILLERDGTIDVGPWKGPVIGNNPRYIGWSSVPGRLPDIEKALA